MAATRSVLRASAQRLVEPGEVLERVNEHLCPDMPEKMFVTCLYGVLDPATGHFRFANAGHDLPYVRTAEGVGRAARARHAARPDARHALRGEGDACSRPATRCCCTPTASSRRTTRHGEMFGFPRLKEAVARLPRRRRADRPRAGRPATRFTGPDAEQEDDITLVTLQRSPGAAHSATARSPTRCSPSSRSPSAAGNERDRDRAGARGGRGARTRAAAGSSGSRRRSPRRR